MIYLNMDFDTCSQQDPAMYSENQRETFGGLITLRQQVLKTDDFQETMNSRVNISPSPALIYSMIKVNHFQRIHLSNKAKNDTNNAGFILIPAHHNVTTLYFHHKDFLLHDTGSGHPESAQRLISIDQALNRPEFDQLESIVPCLREEVSELITLVHSRSMMTGLLGKIPRQGHVSVDPDTILSPDSGRAAKLAVSTVCDAVDKIFHQHATNAFCAIRPPGHHAEPDRAMGFCLFNNVAIAAEYARSHFQLKKIAIIDFDVHHGNGTQAAFWKQPSVLYASSHQMPSFPGSGYASETGLGNIFNVPLKPGDGSAEVREKYNQIIFPAVREFKPELILLSAGFDAHQDDPLASIRLQTEDFSWLTQELKRIADSTCDGRIISVLEGGYNLKALAESVATHVRALMVA